MSGLSLKTQLQGEEKDRPDLQKNSRQAELPEEQAQTVFVILDTSESLNLLRWVQSRLLRLFDSRNDTASDTASGVCGINQ